MKRLLLLLSLVMPVYASAADKSRCGTDSFGNIVCIDKDGVLFNVSPDFLKGEASASGVSDAENKWREEIREKIRCGIDPFGNKVCH
ncbi:MAG: hypothetical protein KJ850_07885 [Gammaproteobacteria bacterium]|nr:hypothetical protein [Gammaproteobacteria bacterium]MBU1624957.1 hypothetical protein [Gammaproteobacteria bacterium]MBU1981217.1 hypothetical protein [Gammaproteobacteria bacterium]